jgi:hypothetical protein
MEPNFLSREWCRKRWSEWTPFKGGSKALSILPDSPGVYRIKPVGVEELVYIGQTGRSSKGRLNTLRRHVQKEEMPYRDPHTAAPALWSYYDALGWAYECSAAPMELSKQDREGLECHLIWQYRLACGRSTYCNHGRLHEGYVNSGNKESGCRGHRLPEGQKNILEGPCLPAIRGHGNPEDDDWMGLKWSPSKVLEPATVKGSGHARGVYKIMSIVSGDIIYIGQSTNLGRRLAGHCRYDWGFEAGFSYAELPGASEHNLHEAENDLIGCYFEIKGRAPIEQFVNTD